jgi:hypothetical protein
MARSLRELAASMKGESADLVVLLGIDHDDPLLQHQLALREPFCDLLPATKVQVVVFPAGIDT